MTKIKTREQWYSPDPKHVAILVKVVGETNALPLPNLSVNLLGAGDTGRYIPQ